MKLLESSVEFIPQQGGLEGIYKQIEIAGRTCYKSEDKITEESSKKFVDTMVRNKHHAMLEHGTVYLTVEHFELDTAAEVEVFQGILYKYKLNPYSKVQVFYKGKNAKAYITTNYRVIVENGWFDDMQYLTAPTEYHERRYTLKFLTDRGVSHELVRQRKFSFAQESQRYCNYSKDKFGGTITYIIPSWFNKANKHQQDAFMQTLKADADCYIALLGKWDERIPDKRFKTGFKENPLTPQEARAILPNATKTEIVVTGFKDDWKHFFDLRYMEVTGKAHPDMKDVAGKALSVFNQQGIVFY